MPNPSEYALNVAETTLTCMNAHNDEIGKFPISIHARDKAREILATAIDEVIKQHTVTKEKSKKGVKDGRVLPGGKRKSKARKP